MSRWISLLHWTMCKGMPDLFGNFDIFWSYTVTSWVQEIYLPCLETRGWWLVNEEIARIVWWSCFSVTRGNHFVEGIQFRPGSIFPVNSLQFIQWRAYRWNTRFSANVILWTSSLYATKLSGGGEKLTPWLGKSSQACCENVK